MKIKRGRFPRVTVLASLLILCSCLLESPSYQISYYVAVISPRYDTAAQAGRYFYIQWISSTGKFPRATITLQERNALIRTIADTINTDIFHWKIPPSLPSGDGYAIKVTVTGDSSLFGTSAPFRIVNKSDGYEPDDSVSQATMITTDGTAQTHTLSYPGDVDWVKFRAIAGKTYFIQSSWGPEKTVGVSYISVMYLQYPDNTMSSCIVSCKADTVCFFKISSKDNNPDRYADTLPYTISVKSVDTLLLLTSPKGGESCTAGTDIQVIWMATNNVSSIGLKLLRNDSVVAKDSSIYSRNFRWTLPISLPTSSNYRLLIYDKAASSFCSQSGLFSVFSATGYSLKILKPNKTTALRTGTIDTVVWASSGLEGTYGACESFSMDLYGDTGRVLSISITIPVSNSTIPWSIPWDLPSSAHYRIKMSCEKDSNVNCFSDEFSISHTISAMQVSNPADGAVFTNDSLMTIQWSVIGKWAYWFNIYLCDSSKPILCIANKFYSDNDRYPWLIPSTIPSGKYRIRVSNAEDSTDNGASGYFTIMRVPTGYTVVSPTAGSTYSGKCTVSWVNVGPVGNQIDIALWNDTSLVQTYGYKFSGNSGSYDCPIPVSLTQGDRYRMQLMAAADTTIWSFSDFFTIVPVPKTVSIAVSPYDTLKGGTYVTLNWSSTGIADAFSIASYFQIDLYDSTKVILKLWSNVGYTSSGGTWKVGKDLPTKSTYRIKMTSLVYPDIFAFTNYFTIVNN